MTHLASVNCWVLIVQIISKGRMLKHKSNGAWHSYNGLLQVTSTHNLSARHLHITTNKHHGQTEADL